MSQPRFCLLLYCDWGDGAKHYYATGFVWQTGLYVRYSYYECYCRATTTSCGSYTCPYSSSRVRLLYRAYRCRATTPSCGSYTCITSGSQQAGLCSCSALATPGVLGLWSAIKPGVYCHLSEGFKGGREINSIYTLSLFQIRHFVLTDHRLALSRGRGGERYFVRGSGPPDLAIFVTRLLRSDDYEHFRKSAHQKNQFFGPKSGLLSSNIWPKSGLN